MDYMNMTVEDCINMKNKGMEAIVNDGKLIGFEHEESVADCEPNNA